MKKSNVFAFKSKTVRRVAILSVAGLSVCALVVSRPYEIGAAPLEAARSFIMLPDREFAAESYVHSPLPDKAPLDERSAAYVADLRRQIKAFYGVASVNIHNFSPPVYLVGAHQPTVRVRAWDRNDAKWSFPPLQEKWLEVPLPADFMASPGTDQEAVVYQPATGKYWEFWQMQKTGAKVADSAGRQVEEWGARWGGRIDELSSNPGHFVTPASGTKFGTTATGLPLLAGLITIAEQQRGVIEHAVHFAIPEALEWNRYSFPAQRSDGQIAAAKNPNAIPEGTTFRLPADLDLDAIEMDAYARMIARAVQKYGMVLRDKSGAVVFYAENPAGRYAQDPYTKSGGILRCPNGKSEAACYPDSNNRLRGFPWDKLQALKTQMNAPIEKTGK